MNRALQDAKPPPGGRNILLFRTPRPSQVDPNIKTATVIPNTPAYVSDRAAVSAAAATVLAYLFPDEAVQSDMPRLPRLPCRGLYGSTQYRFDT